MMTGDEFIRSHLGLYEHRLTVPEFARRKSENRETLSEDFLFLSLHRAF
jgi:hypothetical protein